MKKTDIAMIILIAGVSILVSYFIATATPLASEDTEVVKVKVADTIQPDLAPIDESVFAADGINPSVDIHINGEQSAQAQGSSGSTDSGEE